MLRTLLPAMMLLLVMPHVAVSQDRALEKELQGILEVFLAENPVAPGAAVWLTCPPLGVDWQGAAGTAARDLDTPLTARHTFRIASNTKTYVAAAVLRLAEQGRLDLDDSLAAHLPADLQALLENDGYRTRAITLAQVLGHTAGFADHTTAAQFMEQLMNDPRHGWTSDEQIRGLVDWCDPVGAPGEKFVYSDSGYVILGTIVEGLTGRKLGPAVRELTRWPELDLKVTYWEYMEEAPQAAGPRAHQYLGDVDVTDWYASFDLYGGGGIVTDAVELGLFLRALLKGEVLDREASLAAMTGRGTAPYRLGLMAVDFDGRVGFGHQGFWNTFAFHVPSLDLTVSGNILNHEATNGRMLAARLIAAVDAAVRDRERK